MLDSYSLPNTQTADKLASRGMLSGRSEGAHSVLCFACIDEDSLLSGGQRSDCGYFCAHGAPFSSEANAHSVGNFQEVGGNIYSPL